MVMAPGVGPLGPEAEGVAGEAQLAGGSKPALMRWMDGTLAGCASVCVSV